MHHRGKTVTKPLLLSRLGLPLSEKQIPQVVENLESGGKPKEALERVAMRPRQVRYQAALRPDIYWSLDFKPLSQFPIPSGLPKSTQNAFNRGQTVTKPHQLGLSVSKPGRSSLAFRFIFCRASLFICSFICEYFLNTFASPCRSSCVTHSSATPPALKRVA